MSNINRCLKIEDMVRTTQPCGMLLLLSILSMVLAVACGDAPSSNLAAKQVALDSKVPSVPWSPNIAIALVPDIAGYFRDCNCAGENVGGVERIPFATNDALVRHYVFYGPTLFPESGKSSGTSMSKKAVERIVESTALLWTGLGSVIWVPSTTDLDALKYHDVSLGPLSDFVAHEPTVRIAGVSVDLANGDANLVLHTGGTSFIISSPTRNARGRDLLVIGIWRRSQAGSFNPVMSRTLGAIAMHRPEYGSSAWRVMTKELSKGPVIVSTWRTYIRASMPKSSEIGVLLDAHELRLTHGMNSSNLGSLKLVNQLGEGLESCRNCHRQSVNAWVESRHANAWLTLKSKGQHNNPACLACHVESADTFRNARDAPHPESVHRAAVTCAVCHGSVAAKPTLATCEECHNEHTDPKRRYRLQYGRICPGDRPTQEGVACQFRR